MSTLEQVGVETPSTGWLRTLDAHVGGLVTVGETPVAPQFEVHSATAPKLAAVRELQRREGIYRRCLASADAAAATVSVLFTTMLFGLAPTAAVLIAPILAVVVGKVQGLYDRDDQVIIKSSLTEWRTVLQSCLLTGMGLYLGWKFLTDSPNYGGMRVFGTLVLILSIVTLSARRAARTVARRRAPAERCVVVGDARRATNVAERLLEVPGVELVGMLSEDALTGSVGQLRTVVADLGLHRLLIANAHEPDGRTLHLIEAARFLGIRVSIVPSVMTAVGGFAHIEELDGMTLLGVPSFGLSRSSTLVKRIFDIVVGTAAIIALAPVMAVIAVAIKFDSPGPVLFRQTRIGRDGKPFRILKFRSMCDGADAMKAQLAGLNEAEAGLFKIAQDPRVTRIGRRIRSTHLDELPQLFNVLRGEMSLVGPRPLVLEEDERVVGRDRHRSQLTPGITGPWQVKGPMSTPLSEMAKLDYRYASAWSIWTDLDILIQTVLRVLDRGGH